MIKNLFQLGEPVEHRGIVVAPVFPLRDPVAAYVTLDEALAGGQRVREVDESGSVPPSSSSRTRSTRMCCSTTAESSSARSRTAS
jgi:hypothetical protein